MKLENVACPLFPSISLFPSYFLPGAALGLTLSRVACFPVLTALKGVVILQRRHVTSQRPKQPEKYFFSIGLTH